VVPVEWVAGFVEGEGTFTRHAHWNHTTKDGQTVYYRTYVPTFQVSQKEEQPLLLIAEFFTSQGVRGRTWHRNNQYGGAYEYRSLGAKNCLRIAETLYDHMHSDRKKTQLETWIRTILLYQRVGTRVDDQPTEYEVGR